MKNFWEKLKTSYFAEASQDSAFFCLAPMYDVTDSAFRQMFVRHSKGSAKYPLVLYTEFVSADGLASDEGRAKLLRELYFTKEERPIVAQIFGSNPETIKIAVKIIRELGFDGVDINMGCPDRAVEKQGAGSALIKNLQLAQEIIRSAKSVAGDMPVSVKTRLGYNKIDLSWIESILSAKPAVLTVHLRTRKEMSKAEAHYEVIPDLVKLAKATTVPLVVNGDITSVERGIELVKKYNLAGVMIGRGAFGKPWLFANLAQAERGCQIERPPKPCAKADNLTPEPDLETRLHIMLEHTQLFEKLYLLGPTNDKLFAGHTKNFAVMRKHFKAYVNGFKGATALRAKLMTANNSDEVALIINDFLLTKVSKSG